MTTPTFCGMTDEGVHVFATDEFLTAPGAWTSPADAVRYATSYARCHADYGRVVAALITEYGPRDFGPSGRYWLDNDVVAWFTCPGGMRHGGFFNVVAGVGPAPATDTYPMPTVEP